MNKFDRSLVKGFLHAQGRKIVNGDGQEIVLQGFGCGNWTNPEGFMVAAPTDIELKGDIFAPKLIPPRRFDRRRTFDLVLRELCGTEYAKAFWPKWYRNHLGEADIKAMADLGLNSVRLPINAMTLLEEEPGLNWIEDGFKMLDDVIDWCEKYGIYAILDLHGAPGGQSATACDGGLDNIPHLFIDDESWERALCIWEKLAQRYKDRWIVGGYDLLNEPVSLPNHRYCVPKLAKFYDEAIARIRKIDKNHMFTLEGSCFSRSNEIFDHDYDPECHNWCMHLHIYDPAPEKKVLYPYLLKCLDLNIPIWIGEGGSDETNNAVFYQIASEYGIGFCLWCWKVADDKFGMTNSVRYKLPQDWESVRQYCAGGPKPSYERSQKIFDELLENLKYENCIHNKDFIRKTRRIPPLNLPAVGYDGDEESFKGMWKYGNLLDYRLEDHMKMPWTPGIEEPRPGFDMYEDENIQPPFNPLESLMLELKDQEYASYTIYEVPEGCVMKAVAVSSDEGAAEVYVNGTLAGELCPGKTLEACSEVISLPAGEKCVVKIAGKRGHVALKEIKFI